MLDKFRSLFGSRSVAGRDEELQGEADVHRDRGVADSRAVGGRHHSDGDSASTTGTGDSEAFVGRVAGQDEGYAGTTGAEARAEENRS